MLSGGSVFGLAAADGATVALSVQGIGLRMRNGGMAIPIVPAAVLYDLTNQGDKNWGLEPPYRHLGVRAVQAAAVELRWALSAQARCKGRRGVNGCIGSTSLDLGEGLIVGALVALNSVGSAYMPDGRTFWAWPFELHEEFGGGGPPSQPMDLSDPAPDEARLMANG